MNYIDTYLFILLLATNFTKYGVNSIFFFVEFLAVVFIIPASNVFQNISFDKNTVRHSHNQTEPKHLQPVQYLPKTITTTTTTAQQQNRKKEK